jgi:hypothetical protein
VAGETIWREEEVMANRWLKHVEDGYIFGYTEGLAAHPMLVEVTEEEAFPERFVKPALVETAKKARAARKTAEPALTTDDIPTVSAYNSPELSEDASRGLDE